MRFHWLVPVALLSVTCVGLSDRYAKVNFEGPAGQKSHNLFVQALTGRTGCSAHGGGLYREIAWITIRLPEDPKVSARYEAARLAFVPDPGEVAPVITGGYVGFDTEKREITLSLETATGPYWANGVYPWKPGDRCC
jgi:hypothetical protein